MIQQHPLGAVVPLGETGLDPDHVPFELVVPTPDAVEDAPQGYIDKLDMITVGLAIVIERIERGTGLAAPM